MIYSALYPWYNNINEQFFHRRHVWKRIKYIGQKSLVIPVMALPLPEFMIWSFLSPGAQSEINVISVLSKSQKNMHSGALRKSLFHRKIELNRNVRTQLSVVAAVTGI